MRGVNPIEIETYLSQVRYACGLFGPDGRLRFANPRFHELFPCEKAASPSLAEIFNDAPLLAEKAAQVLAEKNPFTLYETRIFGSETNPLDAEIFPLFGEDKIFLGIALNLFEARPQSLFSEQKKRHDALERLGLIASGLAHEIKNPLSGLKGAAQLIVGETATDATLADYARIISKESERINRLVEELLDFTRPRAFKSEKVNINKVLHEVVLARQYAAPAQIAIREVFDPSLPEITADEDALRQVFHNLIKNAVEAIKATGTVRVKSYYVPDFTLKTPDKRHQILCVQIEDDGCGLSEEQARNIFTPYYSTKQSGSGLGLAIVNRLVEGHGGSIAVKSYPGEGSTFSVYLPV